MSTSKTEIAWCDRTWNPVRGCSRVSPGCVNCYAERMAARFSRPGLPFHGYADPGRAGSRWTGKVELIPGALGEPLSWRKPSRIFVNSMSDLFHEGLSDSDINRVFAVMAQAPRHTFQILTKRADRMRELVPRIRATLPDRLEHVWLGVSVEDQQRADERVPLLLQTPAAVRFLSVEPMLGPVDLSRYLFAGRSVDAPGDGDIVTVEPLIHWVIVGGESGPGPRPMDLRWIQTVVEQCQAARVSVFVKQMGERLTVDGSFEYPRGSFGPKGGDFRLFPVSVQVREFPGGAR